ncbi:MAG: inositol monophosphatase, partial [Geminicoccaceae bacterium]|nr:inositol monophosphatase [Geminicoccaceae bacterium]
MTDEDLDRRLDAGVPILHAAGRLALDFFQRRGELVIEHKGLQDLVSIADQTVERAIRDELGRLFPGDAIIGEEDGAGAGYAAAPGVWVIDPIDGTANFVRGIPQWCVAIACAKDGEAV